MEGWQKLASSAFHDATCIGSESHFDTISISACSSRPTTYNREKIPAENIDEFAKQPIVLPRDASAPNATLQLLRIRRKDNEQLRVSPQSFRTIFKSFDLDPAILYLISNNSYGFHRFSRDTSTSTADKTASCYFVGTVMFVLCWSFDTKTMMSRGIIMTRANNGVYPEEKAFEYFYTILTLYKEQVYTPYLLVLVVAIHVIRYLDTGVLNQLHFLRGVEAYSGHGSYAYVESESLTPASDLTTISNYSRKVGASLVAMANQRRHIEIAESLVAFLHDLPVDSVHGDATMKADNHTKNDSALELLRPLFPVLKQQLQSTTAYHSYLGERARNQSTVLSSLLTHQDAVINTNLAASSREIADAARKDGLAMQALATATKKDGEAMKTVAVMTMAFLPGTFFAALFAVPSLRWDQKPVIQNGFGIYWAFTLPATVIVFVVWILLTNWYGIYDLVMARFRASRRPTAEKKLTPNHDGP